MGGCDLLSCRAMRAILTSIGCVGSLLGCLVWTPANANGQSAGGGGSSLPILTLAEAVDLAVSASPQVRVSLEGEVAAQARIGTARSPWLPQLSASVQTRGDASYQTGLATDTAAVRTLRYSGQLTFNQLLYDFGRTSQRIAAATAGSQSAAADRAAVQAQVALQVINGYYSCVQAEALREVSQRALLQQKQRLLQAESFFKVGSKPEIDVLIAKTAVASAELALVQAQNTSGLLRVQLVQLLGVGDGAWEGWMHRPLTRLAEPLHDDVWPAGSDLEASVDGLLGRAMEKRPDLLSQKERIHQLEAALRALRADYLPTLSLGVSGQMSGSVGGLSVGTVGGTSRLDVPIQGQPGFGITGSLTLAWPILTGLSTIYAVREAEANLRAAQAQLEATRLTVRSQILQALYSVGAAQSTVLMSRQLVQQAERQQAMARGRYRAGVGNTIELGDAEVTFVSSEGTRVQALIGWQVARANLAWQIGELLPLKP